MLMPNMVFTGPKSLILKWYFDVALNFIDQRTVVPGYEHVIYINSDHDHVFSAFQNKCAWVRYAHGKSEVDQNTSNQLVPCTGCLLKAIQRLLQPQDAAWRYTQTHWRFNVYDLFYVRIRESTIHICLVALGVKPAH